MGLYDTIIVNCPDCNEEHFSQSKSGDCLLRTFNLKDCPDGVFGDINRHSPYECDCGTVFKVNMEKKLPEKL
jgi:hypothetical protein